MKRNYSSHAYAFALEAQKPPQTVETERDPDPPLSISQLCDALGWSRSKIEKLRRTGAIPFHRIGNSYPYYYLSEVKEALKNNGAPVSTATASETEGA